jgi:hypothetical protein
VGRRERGQLVVGDVAQRVGAHVAGVVPPRLEDADLADQAILQDRERFEEAVVALDEVEVDVVGRMRAPWTAVARLGHELDDALGAEEELREIRRDPEIVSRTIGQDDLRPPVFLVAERLAVVVPLVAFSRSGESTESTKETASVRSGPSIMPWSFRVAGVAGARSSLS